jgi:hypothetical protein
MILDWFKFTTPLPTNHFRYRVEPESSLLTTLPFLFVLSIQCVYKKYRLQTTNGYSIYCSVSSNSFYDFILLRVWQNRLLPVEIWRRHTAMGRGVHPTNQLHIYTKQSKSFLFNPTPHQPIKFDIQFLEINWRSWFAEMTVVLECIGHTPISPRISSISLRDILLPAPMFWRTFSMPSALMVAWALYWREDVAALMMSCRNRRGSSWV